MAEHTNVNIFINEYFRPVSCESEDSSGEQLTIISETSGLILTLNTMKFQLTGLYLDSCKAAASFEINKFNIIILWFLFFSSCLAVKSSEPSEENETFFSESSLGSKPAAAAGSSPVMVVNSSDEAIYENSQELDAGRRSWKL